MEHVFNSLPVFSESDSDVVPPSDGVDAQPVAAAAVADRMDIGFALLGNEVPTAKAWADAAATAACRLLDLCTVERRSDDNVTCAIVVWPPRDGLTSSSGGGGEHSVEQPTSLKLQPTADDASADLHVACV